jgi:hypothetical protein
MATEKTELRGLCPTALVQALDAFAHAEGMDRNEYVVKVLDEHAKKEGHRATMVQRMLRGNPYLSDDHGGIKE